MPKPDPIIFQTDFSRPKTFLTNKTNTIEILPTVKENVAKEDKLKLIQ